MLNLYSNQPLGYQARINDLLRYAAYSKRDDIRFKIVPVNISDNHHQPTEEHEVIFSHGSKYERVWNALRAVRDNKSDVDVVHFTSLQWYLLGHVLLGSTSNTVLGPNIGPPVPPNLRDEATVRFLEEHYPIDHLKNKYIWDTITRWKLQRINRLVRDNGRFVQCGEWPADSTLLHRGIPERKVSVLPASVRMDLFYPNSESDWSPSYELLMIGSSGRSLLKGFGLAVEAVRLVDDSLSDLTIRVIGLDDPPDTIDDMSDVRQRFEFEGWVPRAELRKKYLSADAFLNTSYSEADGGTVMAESLACGTPVIATRGQAFTTTARDQNTLFFERGSSSELAKTITQFYENPMRYREAARKWARSYDIERAYEKLLSTYQDLRN